MRYTPARLPDKPWPIRVSPTALHAEMTAGTGVAAFDDRPRAPYSAGMDHAIDVFFGTPLQRAFKLTSKSVRRGRGQALNV